jgi:hypothetical protein
MFVSGITAIDGPALRSFCEVEWAASRRLRLVGSPVVRPAGYGKVMASTGSIRAESEKRGADESLISGVPSLRQNLSV